jgi:hypothetical protein
MVPLGLRDSVQRHAHPPRPCVNVAERRTAKALNDLAR